jgi:hypothetical protein
MSIQIAHSGGNAAQLQSVHGLVVYNKDTGKIVLVQNTLVWAGAEPSSIDERSRTALEDAQRRGGDPSKLAVLDLGDKVLEPGRKYSVDPATRSLREAPIDTDRSRQDVKGRR